MRILCQRLGCVFFRKWKDEPDVGGNGAVLKFCNVNNYCSDKFGVYVWECFPRTFRSAISSSMSFRRSRCV